MVGIPQGSVLSSILCSFFYGDLEKNFSKFTNDGQSVRHKPDIDRNAHPADVSVPSKDDR